MRMTVGSGGFTGIAILDFILLGAAVGAGVQILVSLLGGRVPGNGVIMAAGAGAILGAMFHIFRSGIL